MNRERIFILIGFLLALLGLISLGVTQEWQRRTDAFRAGAPPEEIRKAIIPKKIEISLLRPPAIRPGDPVRFGSATSFASVIEFGDFECPSCQNLAKTLDEVTSSFHGRVRLVWRDLPVMDVNPHAMAAAIAARCAGAQGKFWEAHDLLFSAETLNERTFERLAPQLHLNGAEYERCRTDQRVRAAIQEDVDTARGDGIQAAPLLFIGTKAHLGPMNAEELEREITLFLKS